MLISIAMLTAAAALPLQGGGLDSVKIQEWTVPWEKHTPT